MSSATPDVVVELMPVGSVIWSDITGDLIEPVGLTIRYGSTGVSPTDCVAGPGSCTFSLNNSAINVAGLAGRYSPGHANCLTGFGPGAKLRVTVSSAATATSEVKFRGKIHAIAPDAGVHLDRRVSVTAYDGMYEILLARLREVNLEVNQTDDALIATVLDALPVDAQPVARDLSAGIASVPYAFDLIGSGMQAISIIRDIVVSGLGLAYMLGDGTFVYRNRYTRANQASAYTFGDSATTGLDVPTATDLRYNNVRTTNHPRDPETSLSVIYESTGTPITVQPGGTVDVWCTYRDPADLRTFIGAIGVVPPVPGTDYVAYTTPNGTGTVITSDVTITMYDFATTAKLSISNANASTAYLTPKLRGYAVFADVAQTFEASSVQPYGERTLSIDMPYQDSADVAQGLATYVHDHYCTLTAQPTSREMFAGTDALLEQAIEREPGDVITVSETQTGVSALEMVIAAVELRVISGGWLMCRWTLAPHTFKDLAEGVWILGVAGRSELGDTTELGI